MKKPTFSKASNWSVCLLEQFLQMKTFSKLFFCLAFFTLSFNGHAQVGTKFSARLVDADGNKFLKVQGDVKIIGNSILTPNGEALPYNGGKDNNELDAVYVDIDGDAITTSSSSSDLLINNSCKKIVFAGLYWSAMYPNESSTDKDCFNCGTPPRDDWNQVKFKVPGGTYTDIIADKANPREVIFKGENTNDFNNGVYVCFKDVTSIVAPLANADGTYTVGNVRATTGKRRGGSAGGWSLVIIYESPTVSSKYISVFDGAQMTNVDAGSNQLLTVDIPISGFQTLPSPFPVNAKIGVAALDGDYGKKGDGLLFVNGLVPATTPNSSFTPISNTLNPLPNTTATPPAPDFANSNFFNASITVDNANVLTRNPYSSNNLGFDIDYLSIPNPSNGVIPNGATQGTYRMFTDTVGGDGFAAFLTTFAVDIIEPKILLTKEVYDNSNPPLNMGDKDVTLSQQLNYVIGFQNQGNDNATSFTIKDVLPINVKFNYPDDITSLPPDIVLNGVTYSVTHTYDAATRTILFSIPNVFVEVNDPRYVIRLGVKVVDSCNELSDACSNIIKNIALSSYSGTYNTAAFGDESLSSYTTCNVGIPQSTNFLVGVDDCKFTKSEVLCGNSVDITASSGYSTYEWSTAPYDSNGVTTGTILGSNQTLTVTDIGTYYVYNTAIAPCLSITEEVTVSRFGTVMTNPLLALPNIPDEIVTCVSGGAGKQLPYFFLCGADATRLLTANVSDGSTIVWERLSKTNPNCTAVSDPNCANENINCNWIQMGTGANYTLASDIDGDSSGEYRITLQYPGGCFNRFYFNVYQNTLNPTETHSDIICNTKGNITIGGIPLTSYEYSISAANGNTPSIPYQSSNSFTIDNAGLYTVFIKQIGVTTNPCIFEIKNIPIRSRNFTVDEFITDPICYGDKGSIKLAANDVRGPYTYEIFKNGSSLNKYTTANSDYTFSGLDSGRYSYTVSTADGCTFTNYDFAIADAAGEIIATPSIIVPLTACNNGIIRIETQQDRNYSNSFSYFVNGSSTFQTTNEIEVSSSGLYTIRIVGLNNCEVTVTQQIDLLPKPTYDINSTSSTCYGSGSEIRIENVVANGYSMSYSINNGGSFSNSTTFPNLAAGTYNVIVRYGLTYTSLYNGQQTIYCQDPAQEVIITGPTSAVTASAGVGELAGCGPLDGGQPTGLLRITNVEGGTFPYEYSFDGGNIWDDESQKYVTEGTYNLAVRDALGCIYQIPYSVTLDPKPEDPQINDNPVTVYNCDGTATATVVVETPTTPGGATFTYEYYFQKDKTGALVANDPITSNVFTNVPIGDHNVVVRYKVETVSSYSNLLNEDFGKGGFTTTAGINPAYCFEDEATTHLAPSYKCNKDEWINDGEYAVASSIRTTFGGAWIVAKDHTLPSDPLGRFLAVNVGGVAGVGGILYSKPIKDVIPNQPVIISLWAENLFKALYPNKADPELTIQLVNNLNGVGGTETIVATTDTANPWAIPKSEKWEFKELSLNPGTYNNLSFVVRSYNTRVDGNDILIDDIWVRQIPRSCGNEKTVSVEISGDEAFDSSDPIVQNVSCNGGTDGSIQITAQQFDTTAGFFYSVNNGSTWTNSTVSPVTVSNLGVADYSVIVQYDMTGNCKEEFEVSVAAPAAIDADAFILTQPTCIDGATIRASATGGSGNYQYELRTADGLTAIAGYEFSALTDFVDVPSGTYTVVAKDINDCLSPATEPILINTPTAPNAALDPSSDLCYDAVNEATLVVNATGGSGTYSYQLDTQTAQSDNTFSNVGPGIHTITVTDTNNCTAVISDIIIAPALIAATPVVTELLCDPATDATITIGLTGGTLPYSYTVNGGNSIALGPLETSLIFSTDTADTYVFVISDASGCSTTATATVNTITNPTVDATPTQVSCNSGTDGQVTLVGSGGSGGFTYSFNGSGFTATTVYTGLSAGVAYPYQVRDSKGCLGSGTITLTQPTVLTTTASVTTPLSCNTSNVEQTAEVTVEVPTTGTSPYVYTFNGTSNGSNTFTVTDNGTDQTINIVVTDANGCTFNTSVVVNGLNPPTALAFAADAVTCDAPQTTLTVTATNGVAPLTYAITSPAGAVTSNTTGSFANLASGTYNFRVTDANGCYFEDDHTITPVTPIAVTGNPVSNVLCNAGATGAITYSVSGNATVGNYTFTISPNTGTAVQTGNSIAVTGLAAGSYTINVTDSATGCTASTALPITITEPAVLSLTATAANVNCNQFNSQITGTATGGTAGYTYAAVVTGDTAPAPTVFAANPIVVNTNSGANLVWDVYAKDVNGCTAMRTVTIIYDNQPTVTAVLGNQCTATSDSTFTITATGNGGVAPLEYSIDGADFSNTTGIFTVSSRTAPYIVTVKDANGCTGTAAAITVYPRLTANAQTTKELDCTTSPDATITTTITGGRAPYSYTVTKGTGTPSASITGVAGPTFTHTVLVANADDYTFTITDANGCITTATATVLARTNPTVAIASQVNVSCNAGTNGSVTLTGTNGSGGYTYSNNATSGFTTNATFAGLAAGSYTFYVKDSKDCTGSVNVTITQPTVLTTTASVTTPLSCDTSNVKQTAVVTVVPPTTGTSPYVYTFNGTSNGSNTFTVTDNGTDQTINIVVTDANGCTFNTSVVVNGLNPPTALIFDADPITCNAPQTTLTVTATNGVAPLTFAITSPAGAVTSNSTGSFTNLTSGTYNFRVTDANGCYFEDDHTITPVTPIAVTGNVVSHVLCNAGTTGAITYSVSGNATVGNYTFTISPNTGTAVQTGNSIAVTGLAAGSYTINVIDSATGCTASTALPITITQPAVLSLTATAANVNCNQFNSQITGTATGGTPGYTYAAVRTGQPAPVATVYAANPIVVNTNSGANLVWDVYAKDVNGCTAMRTVTIIYDNQPTVTAVLNNQCTAASDSTFTITATGNGGVAPLEYSIDGTSFQSSNVFNNLISRTAPYIVTVKDANGCTGTAAAITVYPQLTANAQTTKELDCTTTPDAVITTTITGGRAPYSYTVTKGTGTPSASITGVAGPTFTHTVLVANADDYTFTITDANGCITTATATVLARTNPTVAIANQVNVSCNAGTNGLVTLTGSLGSGGYTYSNNATSGFTTNATFTGLAAGSYTFYVKDSKDCTGSVNVTITQPDAVTATIAQTALSCSTTNTPQTATITVTPSGGTGAYTYSFNNGSTFGPSNTITVTNTGAAQSFQIIVKDANSCLSVAQTVTIAPLNPPVIASIVPSVITCNATTSNVTINTTGGVGTLNYQMTSPSVVNNGTNNVFTGLVPNVNYTFRVTDANGCYDTEILRINPATRVTVTKQILSNVNCFGGANGSARFTVENNVGAVTVSLTNGLGNPVSLTTNVGNVYTYANLSADTYTFTVTDAGTGCQATESVIITQPAAGLAASYVTVNANCNVATSRVTVTTTGGTQSYRYSFVTSATTPDTYNPSNVANLNPTTSLNWFAHIIDANGCTFVLPITIASDPVPTVSASATNQCLGSGTYTITALNTTSPVSGIVTPITYSIDNGASWQPGTTFTVTTAGDYVIRMKDGNGCIATSNTVTVHPRLTLSAVLNKNITCSTPADAQFTLTATGGNPGAKTYEYSTNGGTSWLPMASTVLNTSVVGSYVFRVTDLSTCTAVTTVPLSITAPVIPEMQPIGQTQFIGCHGDNSAAISVVYDPALGQTPFVINVKQYAELAHTTLVNDFGTQTSGLPAGFYVVRVTDAKGCFDEKFYTITQPDEIDVQQHAVPITCDATGISKGSVIVDSVDGGVGPYNYFVTGVNGYSASELNNSGTTSTTFDIVDFGLYQINVVDSNGCSVLIQNVIVASPVDDLDIDIQASVDCDTTVGGTAIVSIPATGSNITGSGPFYFNIYSGVEPLYPTIPTGWIAEDSPGSKSATFTNLTPGVTYTFVVYDADIADGGTGTGCYYYETADQPIPTNSDLTVSTTVTQNITCVFHDLSIPLTPYDPSAPVSASNPLNPYSNVRGADDGKVSFTITNSYPSDINVTLEIFNSQSLVSTGVTRSVTVPANDTFDVLDLGPLPLGNYFVLIKEDAGSPNAGCSIVTDSFNITQSSIPLSVAATATKNANCNPDSGIISAIAKDGKGPYTYQILLDTATAPTASDAGWATANTFNKDAGSYTVYAKDAYGCIAEFDILLDADDAPTINLPAPICYDGNEFTITLSGTVDPGIIGGATYSVNGSAFQASPDFTFNAAGTYNLVIQDGNGCPADVDFVVHPQLELKADLTKELDCTGTPDAAITLTATGGDPAANYTYEVNINGGGFVAAANPYTTATATGTYEFRVTDADNPTLCQATATITLDPIPTPTITPTVVDASCFGGSDGEIAITVTGGVGPFTYTLAGAVPANTSGDTTGVYTGLIAGNTYQVTVTDAKSCTYTTAAITVGQAAAVSATSSITSPLECTTGNAATKAVVTITASGGNGNYLYSYDLGLTYIPSNVYETYVGETFDVYIKDTNDCPFVLTDGVNIPVLDAPTDMDITGTPIYCMPAASQTSTVTINSVTDGVGVFTYTILPSVPVGVTQTGNVFAGLTAGDYTFEVTDANGCTYQELYTVDDVTNITVSGQVTADVTCFGLTNGTAEFTVGNFGGTYTSALIAGTAGTFNQTGDKVTITGLTAGTTYTLEVTDAITGCTETASVTVAQPSAALSVIGSQVQAANCDFGARVTAVANGGTPNYTYAYGVTGGSVPAAGDYTSSAAAVLDQTLGLNWTVYVKDANDCTAQSDFSITIDALPTIDLTAATYCYNGSPMTITITGTGVAPLEYSIGNGYFASPNFTLNAPGNYTFYIKDANGCIVSTPYTLRQQLLLQATMTQDLTCDVNASINVLATQGTTPYGAYEVSFNGGGFTAIVGSTYTTSTAGDYQFRVTDAQNCQALSNVVTVTPTTTPDFTATQVNVSCPGGSDGTITITAANGIAPYTYSISTINGGAFQTDNYFTGLAAGTYSVTIKDAKGCPTAAVDVTITEPNVLLASIAVTTPLSCGTSNAATQAEVTVTVDATTGTAPYQYSFDGINYSSNNVYKTFTPDAVTAYVRDANGCAYTGTLTTTIDALDAPVITTITGTDLWCSAGNTQSTVTVSISNGIGSPAFEILEPASAVGNTSGVASGIFTGLDAGTYLFRVTDDNGCTDEEYYTVEPLVNITVSGQVTADVTCFGLTNGTAEFTVGNFGGTYTSALIAGTAGTFTQTADKVTITGLTAGTTYTLEVTDAITGCTETASVTVTQPSAALSVVGSQVQAANCDFGARVTAVANGGTLNYTYAYGVTGGSVPAAGDYTSSAAAVLDQTLGLNWTVYVKDANDCTSQADFSITIDALPTIDLTAATYCYDGSPMPITITGTGVAPLEYSIGNGYFASPNFTLNAPGDYTFYIKDANGCIVSTPYTLRQELLLQATMTQDLTCDVNASINVLATQGTTPYGAYEVSFNGGGFTAIVGSTYTTSTAGDYQFRVTDAQGCQALSNVVTVTPTTTPDFTATQVNVSCPGGSDGTITITALNGIAPYTYSISTINGGAFQTDNYFTGLAAGTYTILVEDAKGCPTATADVTITEPNVLLASIAVTTPLSCGTSNAATQAEVTVTVDATTGTAPYQYSFDGINYSSNNVYKTFTPDAVTAYVRDANGCAYTGTLTTTIDALDAPVITTISGTDLWCSAGNTQSTVTVSISNGIGSPAFEILEPASAVGNTSGATSGIFTGLDAGTYLFRVTDDNGCTDEEYYTVEPLVNITVSGQETKAVSCNGEANGTLEFKVANYTGTFSAVLSPLSGVQSISGDTVTITGLSVGSYTLNVTDLITGCINTATASVTEPNLLVINLVTNTNATCTTDAQVTVLAAGGTPTYTYAFKPLGQAPVAGDYAANAFALLDKTITNWIAYVKDSNDCEAQLPITIATDALPAGFTATLTSDCPSAAGTYVINVVDGTGVAPFQYSIGSGFQTSPAFTVSTPGNYDITIKDANECEVTFPTAVTILEPLVLATNVTALPSCSFNDGSVEVSVTGGSGTGNYRFILDGGAIVSADSHIYTGLSFGSHTIVVRDVTTGCEDLVTLDLIRATDITDFALAKTDVTCNGGNNGTITATIGASSAGVNDNPIYTYELAGTTLGGVPVVRAAQTLPVFANLEAGDYTIKVISGRGCEDQEDITIIQPDNIVVNTPTVTQFVCTAGIASSFATITVDNVTGGSGTYAKYEFFRNGVSVQAGPSNTYKEFDTTGGNYTVTVTDSKDCIGSTTTAFTINPYISLEDIIVANTKITCLADETITVSVLTNGGTPVALQYTLVDVNASTGVQGGVYPSQTNTTGVFLGLTVADYLITVTNPATGCSIKEYHYVNEPNTFDLKAVKISDVICYGSNEGEVELTIIDQFPTPTDEAGAFTYTVTGPTPSSGTSATAGPLTLSGLTAGVYTVTARLVDTPNCTVSTNFTIVQPSAVLAITETHTEITCNPGNNGSISVTASGGWVGDYSYEVLKDGNPLSAYSAQTYYDNLSAGTYTINVRDSKGCVDTEIVILADPTAIQVTAVASTSLLSCNGDESATVTATAVSGGQGSNYLYTLNYESMSPVVSSGPQADPMFTGLGAGTYSITVTDGWGCSITSAPVTIDEPSKVEASLVLATSQTCLVQSTLTLSATGGTAPYTYSDTINFATSTPMIGNSATFSVANGDFRYYVRDVNGCTSVVSNDVQNDPLEPLEIILDVRNSVINCKDDITGVIAAEAKGGLGNYRYTLQDAAGNPIAGVSQNTTGIFDGLAAGDYRVYLESGDCNTTSALVSIVEPDTALSATHTKVDVTCNGNNDGKITVTASGGTGIIKYAISPDLDQFFDTGVFENLAPGEYEIIVQDENGCFIYYSIANGTQIVIEEPIIITAAVVPGSIVQSVCSDFNEGAFSITISGGVGPYSTSLDDPNGTYVLDQVDFTGLTGGDHTVYIMDANTCTSEIIVSLDPSVTLDPVAVPNYDCVNDLPANSVTVTIDPSNNPADVTYSLDNSGVEQASNVFTNLVPGEHFIMVSHANGCVAATDPFTIDQIDPLGLTLALGELNQIVATATGGSGVYQYSFNFEQNISSNKYIYFRSGNYTVTVTDSNGCSITVTQYFEFIDIEIPNVFTPNGSGTNDTWKPTNTENYPDIQFVVYDRYGREVGRFGAGESWDGKYNSNELPMGDYWYVLKLRHSKDDREFIGHFTLYR